MIMLRDFQEAVAVLTFTYASLFRGLSADAFALLESV